MSEATTAQLSLIVALISLCAPVLTTLANIGYQLLVRHLDQKQKKYDEQIKPIENIYIGYLSALGKAVADTVNNRSEYGKYFPLVLLYVPEEKRKLFIDLDKYILSFSEIKNVDSTYNEVISIVQTELAKLYTRRK